MNDDTIARIQNSPEFIELSSQRRAFAWTLTILMLVIYFGFIGLVAFLPATIGTVIAGSITVGIALGIAVILSAVLLTGIYVWRANTRYDAMTSAIIANAGSGVRK